MSQRPQEAPHGPDADGLTERQRRALAALMVIMTNTMDSIIRDMSMLMT